MELFTCYSSLPLSIRDLVPTQPPFQWLLGALSLGVKRPGRESDRSPPFSADVKNAWSCISISPLRLHSVMLS